MFFSRFHWRSVVLQRLSEQNVHTDISQLYVLTVETVFYKGDQIFRIAVCRIYTVKGPDFRLIIGDNKASC